ncbi:MAG: protein translocase subunit SecD [Alphaproteobacteria bacterium TMED89]|nr:protein translocase subunit SecD [Rhodospirillaceae bacterium]RPH13744.1 MAG: protein translocase subunit SecD [Alphaproteobacteria bacterium TMED89]
MLNTRWWQPFVVVLVVLGGMYFAAPNLYPRASQDENNVVQNFVPFPFLPYQVNLGLDLQGGSYRLVRVDLEDARASYMEDVQRIGSSVLRDQGVALRATATDTSVRFQFRDEVAMLGAREILRQQFPSALFSDQGSSLTVTLGDDAFEVVKQETVQSVRDTIERRIDAFGLTEPSIRIQGQDRILIEVPGVSNIDAYLEKLALTIHIVKQAGVSRNPNETLFMMLEDSDRILGPGEQPTSYLIEREACVDGADIQGTGVGTEYGVVVTFTLNSRGSKDFATCTRNNVGERLAIVLDDKVISAPSVNEPITTGSVQISGGFSFEEARSLSTLLGTGSLAAEVESIEERVVGPGLGAESIRSGAIACIVAMALVLLFMTLAYGLLGLMANVALVFNLIMLLGMLSIFGATLTLPGIAGIVLTVGMAVDANVLVFERIREEARAGLDPSDSVASGYGAAFSTILDANLTTVFAAILLAAFGTGPIQGFAMTLTMGILTSMFTALLMTRLLINLWLDGVKPSKLPI